MTGLGSRFVAAGYKDPKPLIYVDGKPMIEHVMNLMPGEQDVIYVCNENHKTTNMEGVLKRISPHCTILWRTKDRGPVPAVLETEALIDDKSPYMISYCDFGGWWDYEEFKKVVISSKCDAALPAYIDFHPHLLNKALYVSMRVSQDMWLQEIREKYSFTENPMDSYQQPGLFYFSSGALIKKYFHQFLERGEPINGEYYISMVYDQMLKDKLKILVYPMPYFCQWGTPQDLQEYQYWSDIFRQLAKT